MSSVDRLIEPLRHSPLLPKAIAILQAELEMEQKRREQFYQEMIADQKTEFIDAEVVLHSPARNRHLDVTSNVLQLVRTYVSLHELGQVKSEKCLCACRDLRRKMGFVPCTMPYLPKRRHLQRDLYQ